MTMYHSINMIQDMRKHIYIIMVMLLGCIGQLRAQDAVSIVGYEYWFDTNFDARVKVDTTSTSGNYVYINEKYTKYFDKHAEFYGISKKSAVYVSENGVLCGIIMPIRKET